MDLTLSADQVDLRSGLAEFLQSEWTPDSLRAAAKTPDVDLDAWRRLAELGFFGVLVPETDGGMGLGMADAVILCEEAGRRLVPGPVVASLLAAGQIPGVMSGESVVALLDERDLARVAEHLPSASHLVVLSTDGVFLHRAADVDSTAADTPLDPLTGMAVVAGYRGDGEQIGAPDDAERWRLHGAVLTAALQVGVARGALELATQYAKERIQFGRPVGSFQAVKHLLAELLVRVDLARAAVLTAALTVDDPDAGDVGEAVAAAKILADDAAGAGGRTCVQVHGGMGFTWEVLAHLYLKRAWVHEASFGGADEHAEVLARAL